MFVLDDLFAYRNNFDLQLNRKIVVVFTNFTYKGHRIVELNIST